MHSCAIWDTASSSRATCEQWRFITTAPWVSMIFPAVHGAKLHSVDTLERLNGEVKRRTDVVGIFPNKAAIRRPLRNCESAFKHYPLPRRLTLWHHKSV